MPPNPAPTATAVAAGLSARAATVDAIYDFAARVDRDRLPAGIRPGGRARVAVPDSRLHFLRADADALEAAARQHLSGSETARLNHMLSDIFHGGEHELLAERTLLEDLYTVWREQGGPRADGYGLGGWLQPAEQNIDPFPDMPSLRVVDFWVPGPSTGAHLARPAADRTELAATLIALARHTADYARPAPGWHHTTAGGPPAPVGDRAWTGRLQQLASTVRDTLIEGPEWLTAGETARTGRVFAALVQLEHVTAPDEVFTLVVDADRFGVWAGDRRAGLGGLAAEQQFADEAYLAAERTRPVTHRGIDERTGEFTDMPGLARLLPLYPSIPYPPMYRTLVYTRLIALARAVAADPIPNEGPRARQGRIAERAEAILYTCRDDTGDHTTGLLAAEKRRAERVVALIVTEADPFARYTPEQLARAVFDAADYEQLVTDHNAVTLAARRRGLGIDPGLPGPGPKHWTHVLEYTDHAMPEGQHDPVARPALDDEEIGHALAWLAGRPDWIRDSRAVGEGRPQLRARTAAQIVHAAHGLARHDLDTRTAEDILAAAARAAGVDNHTTIPELDRLITGTHLEIGHGAELDAAVAARPAPTPSLPGPAPAPVPGRLELEPAPAPGPALAPAADAGL